LAADCPFASFLAFTLAVTGYVVALRDFQVGFQQFTGFSPVSYPTGRL
jgi:hypothetical protein